MLNKKQEMSGNPLASKELDFVSRFWGSEEIETQFSKSFYFGVEAPPKL